MATFVVIILVFLGFFLYDRVINSASPLPSSNKFIKSVTYTKSDKFAILEVRWKEDMKLKSAKNRNNYLVEHVVPMKGKWMTTVDGKKCTISFVQHVPDALDPEKKSKVTQISVNIEPKEAVNDYFRVRVRNVKTKEGEKIEKVEYGVAKVSTFANFTKK